MGIENLKRWHWVVIAVGIGLLGAWVQTQMGPQGMQTEYATLGTQRFESLVLGRPMWGLRPPPAQDLDLNLYPLPDGKMLATAYLPVEARDAQGRPDPKMKKLRLHQLIRATPYMPVSQLDQPPHFELKMNAAAPSRRGRGSNVTQEGWQPAGRGLRDPGDGATVEFPLRPAACELSIRVATAAASRASELKVLLNEKPFTLAPDVEDRTVWRTSIPASAFRDGRQTLKLSRGAKPLPIVSISIINPRYSLHDFLVDAKERNEALEFTYRWDREPRTVLALWTVGSVVLIGGIWPTLLHLLVGAGLGRPPKEPEYDLSRFKGEAKKAEAPAPAPMDDAELLALEEEMLRKLEAEGVARGEDPTVTAAPEPAPKLVGEPVVGAPVAAQEDESREYKGEFYPVARKVEK